MKRVFVLSAAALLAACVTESARRENPWRADFGATPQTFRVFAFQHPDHDLPSIAPHEVKIYDGFEPTREYLIVGRLVVNAGDDADEAAIQAEMRRRAGAMGGHGIIITGHVEETYDSGSRTDAIIIPHRSWVQYLEFTKLNPTISVRRTHAYVVRWKE